MNTNFSTTRYDPARMIRLQALRGLFVDNRPIKADQIFELQARDAGAVISTGRARLADESDRHLVYKQVHI